MQAHRQSGCATLHPDQAAPNSTGDSAGNTVEEENSRVFSLIQMR